MRQYESKPTYYIWKTNDSDEDDICKQKLYWQSMGFRTVVFHDGDCNNDINIAMKAIIQNHLRSS